MTSKNRTGRGRRVTADEESWKGIQVPGIGLERDTLRLWCSWHLQSLPLYIYSQVHTCPHPEELTKPRQRARSVYRMSVHKPPLEPCAVMHTDSSQALRIWCASLEYYYFLCFCRFPLINRVFLLRILLAICCFVSVLSSLICGLTQLLCC